MERTDRKKREFQRREQEILKVTESLLSGVDADSVTVERIATEVGIGKGTIYKHFKTKHEIVARLIEITLEDRMAVLSPKDRTPLDRITDYVALRIGHPHQFALVERWMSGLRQHRQAESLELIQRLLDAERLKLAELLDQAGCVGQSRSAHGMAGFVLASVHGILALGGERLNPDRPDAMNTIIPQVLADLAQGARAPRKVTVL
ncbi:MAG: TetR/AcrR family transcriptional regulator [Litorivicinus sp.]